MMANFVMNTSLACLPSLRLQEMILARTMMTLSAVLTIVLSMQQRQHNTQRKGHHHVTQAWVGAWPAGANQGQLFAGQLFCPK